MTLLRILYNLLFPFVLVVMLPSFLLRMIRRGNYRHKFGQRFGIYSKRVQDKLRGRRWTWIHAVSVGEVMIALKLVRALREAEPDLGVVLSTTTSTGYRLAHRHKSADFEPVYHPMDLPWIVKRTLDLVRPTRMILVEAEVWPNMMAEAAKRKIPRVLVNARLSPRSEKRYRSVRPLAAALFNQLDALCAQDPLDRGRWESLGVKPEKIHVTGSIKFDPEGETSSGPTRDFWNLLEARGIPRGTPVLLGGSTFEGEETGLAETTRRLRKEFPDLVLVLVPRHAERSRKVLSVLLAGGHRAVLRSEEPDGSRPEILVVNTTGELRDWYACATVVFIGKSLAPGIRGGQNPVEAVLAGKPVLFGPNMQNFATLARQMVEAGGALEVESMEALESTVSDLLRNPQKASGMAEAARTCLDFHKGATARTVKVLLP